ncbi:MAG: TonB-dependent receptor [Caulobacter sp.]|nr:TonB-dependent receptor [Caulobacter sp.]
MLDRKQLLSSTIIAGLTAFIAGPAFAQTPPPAPPPADDNQVEAVVITGSRIKRNEFTSPDPIQVIRAEQGRLKGVGSTAALLQSSTIASGSPQVTSLISSAFVSNGGPGVETVSLRGLGANRTLVLLNGRRAGPAGTQGSVSAFDLNVIPQSAIDRVEILKDGASSIYGSDAVAGVVNIITKRDTDGIELETFASQPEKKGGAQYRGSLSWGKTFDRGYFNISADYFKQTIQRNGNRKYTGCGEPYTFRPGTGERTDPVDPRTGKYQCRDLLYDQIWLYDGNNFSGRDGKLQYDYGGNLGQYIPRVPPGEAANYPGLPPGYFVVGYDDPSLAVADYNSPFNLKASLTPRVERTTIFSQGSFEITDHIELYGEFLLNRRASKTDGYRQFWTYLYTPENGDPFNEGFTGNYILSPTIATDRADNGEKVTYGRAVVGLRGDFAGVEFLKGWDWDLFGQFSKSKGAYSQDVILQDSVYSADGRSNNGSAGLFNDNSIPRPTASCVGYKTPIGKLDCVDVDWTSPNFLAGKLTPAEEGFLFASETGHTVYKQTTIEGSTSGDLFSLPAGKVGIALGFQYRRDSINDTPGSITLSGNAWGSSGAGITRGKDNTKEVFGELGVPLLRDLPLVKRLDLSLSGRHTDVASYGADDTYKIGLNWQVFSSVRLRATQGTSFRAPALYELYLADQTAFLSQRTVDPCIRWQQNVSQGNIPQRVADNCSAAGIPGTYTGAGSSVTTTSGGGKGELVAETSKAKTFGVIWTPAFANLNVAVDYFDIKVSNEVRKLGADQIVYQCYNSETFPTDPLCGLFARNASHLITNVRDDFLNVAKQVNRGIDLTVSYARDLPWDTKLTVDLQSTWQLKDTIALFVDNTVDNNGDIGDPDWSGQLNFSLVHGDWTGFWGIDAIGKGSDAEDISDLSANGATGYKVHTEFTAYHSFSVEKKFATWRLLAGVANAFDEAPPAITQNLGQSNTEGYSVLSSQYDYVGRRFFMTFSTHF